MFTLIKQNTQVKYTKFDTYSKDRIKRIKYISPITQNLC